mgnify:CR=1 FL=1
MRTVEAANHAPTLGSPALPRQRSTYERSLGSGEAIAPWVLPLGVGVLLFTLLDVNLGANSTVVILAVGLVLCCLGLNRLGLSVAVLLFVALPLSNLPVPLDSRYAALVPLAILASYVTVRKNSFRHLAPPLFLAIVTVVSAASTAVTAGIAELAEAPAAMALLSLGTLIVGLKLPNRELVTAGLLVTGSLLALSLLSFFSGSATALRGERVQGVIANPNGLGTIAVFVMIFALLHGNRLFVIATPFALLAITLSQSRASGVAALLLALMALAAFLRFRLKALPTVLLLIATAALAYLAWVVFALRLSGGIFRTNNSREEVWDALANDFYSSPVFGVGWKQVSAGSQGFFHLMAAQAGLIGLALAFAAILLIWFSLSPLGWRGIAVTCSIVVLATFEGWLLTGGSGYAWLAWTLTAVYASNAATNRSTNSSDLLHE